MRKNYFKRMKKSTVALAMGFVLLGGSTVAYAAETYATVNEYGRVGFTETIASPVDAYELSTVERDSYAKLYASLIYTRTNCDEATVRFFIKHKDTGVTVSGNYYQTGKSTEWHNMDYLDIYALRLGDMNLMAKTASSHSGYFIGGFWQPNGYES